MNPLSLTLALGLVLTAQAPKPSASARRADPDQFPLALHRSMEIDDLDREIQRLRDTVSLKRAQLSATQRLATRGLVSRGDLECESADLRYQEAREAEAVAYRALKAHERDVIGQVSPTDDRKTYALLLDWVRKQKAIAQVDADYRAYDLKQTRALYQRKAVSREEMDNAELAHNTALAGVALSRSREAQVLLELAARSGEKPHDPVEYHRLKSEYLKARVRYFEVSAEGAHRRLEIARDRGRLGLLPTGEVALIEKAAAEADTSLAAERKALADHEAVGPQPDARPPGGVTGLGPRRRRSPESVPMSKRPARTTAVPTGRPLARPYNLT
jgi:hypothetical protein